MCRPAWRCSDWYHPAKETNETFAIDFSIAKNTKRHKSRQWGPPDAIRGCRRQQETVRENAQLSFTLPICPAAGADPCVGLPGEMRIRFALPQATVKPFESHLPKDRYRGIEYCRMYRLTPVRMVCDILSRAIWWLRHHPQWFPVADPIGFSYPSARQYYRGGKPLRSGVRC